jgi:hypothetical protein
MEDRMIVIENVRALPRATVNSPGRIVLADLSTTRAVTIRDLSVRGACLSADNWSDIPNVFYLLIRGRANAEPIRRTCHKRWKVADVVGVRFSDPLTNTHFEDILRNAMLPLLLQPA